MGTRHNPKAVAAVIGAACLMMTPMLAAQDAEVVPPEPVELQMPEAPANPFGSGPSPEGWVKLRYSVTADGGTTDVRVVDAMPPNLDTSNAVAAVRQWSFTPASEDGQPIEWHNNVTVISFDQEDSVLEATPMFAEAYEEVAELMSEERLSRAKSRNETMLERSWRLYEVALAQVQLAALESAAEDSHAALIAIRRATEPDVRQLSDAELKTALEYRFALEVELGRVVDALATYERRAALEALSDDEPLARQAAAIRDALRNEEVALAAQARIERNGPWAHELSRRTFAVGDLDGRLEDIGVECNRRKATLPFEADVEVTIPDSWGECTLFFNGRRNTTFTLYEFL